MIAPRDQTVAASTLSLPQAVRQALVDDRRRVVVVGARGWVGRTLLELLDQALGAAAVERVACFGSQQQTITLSSGRTFEQAPLDALALLDRRPSLVFHLAFLTMDKVREMSAQAYSATNRAISALVLDALDGIGADRLFVASSGAAAYADDPAAAPELRLYGGLKRDDEAAFAAWAHADAGQRRAAICRIYSLSGPFINKHATYALADLILRAQRGEAVAVQSPRAVWRSYVAVKEVIAMAFAFLLAETGDAVLRFDSGGLPVELGQLAAIIADRLGGSPVQRPITAEPANRYCGDHAAWLELLRGFGLHHMDIEQQIAETAAYLRLLDERQFHV